MSKPISGFDWDDGNWPKCAKHGLTKDEIEYVLRHNPLVRPDRQGGDEVRFDAVGRTLRGRHVFAVFTLRDKPEGRFIRPISARYMHDKEVKAYDQTKRP